MKKLDKFDMVICGVGGQGVLTVAGIVARAALVEGYNIKAAELHGLAMRFGALETHLRFGNNIHSPLIKSGEADLIISLEPVEAVRASRYSNNDTNYVFDQKEFIPNVVHREKKKYPGVKEVVKTLKEFSPKGKVFDIPASDLARKEFGNVVAANIVLLGKAVGEGLLPLKKQSIFKAMEQVLPSKFLEPNKKIFEVGFKLK
ncbi:MAG: indolepyruvate oxidoreductase subunit beta [Nanoarchaeota archaeon]|nr:indolepyruvate oxidoreductase subunit beta [Nanoarchaeota archaeon]